ncbi:TetR/AcrR family transcriptional regulator [Lentzea jiangxiensis]|uniref:DNA-binding transcriptional regulator, AcrR family n=1 Tax=Lentzea jiangxiensis TaxID=641025 RepID=A0A1H0J6Q3_9PSEU|nr:TetR/AcrR family transcriptional regulator [Lentzea jiangxiensis]SDO39031.1 DNA-binding transcriptional regulator, AcrR family [Lentzea jiangxiensis]
MTDRQRADARRNHERILAVAEREVAAHGAQASLEQIARVAGVGSATVRRHFPTRQALLEAVLGHRIELLCERARELTGAPDGREALLTWLDELVTYCVTAKGLATALAHDGDPVGENSCATVISEAAGPLLRRAVAEGAVTPDVTAVELVSLIVGIAMVTEHHRDPAASAGRLFAVAVAGIGPARAT